MTEPRSDAAFLADILAAARDAQGFIEGTTFDEFSADRRTVYAVTRAFEIIGEASKRISPDFKEKHPELPWKLMAGMRDKLIHGYFGVDLEVLWKTACERLPSIVPQLVKLLTEI
jgi:uncharacterized protein with HEPN domain